MSICDGPGWAKGKCGLSICKRDRPGRRSRNGSRAFWPWPAENVEVAPRSWGRGGLNKEKSRYGRCVFLGAAETELAGGMWLCRRGTNRAAPCPNPSVQSPNGAEGEDKGRLLLFAIARVYLILHLPALPQKPQHRCYIAQALMQPRVLRLTPIFALLGGIHGRCTTPQSGWPQRFPFLGIKRDASPKTTGATTTKKKTKPKKAMLELLLFFRFF